MCCQGSTGFRLCLHQPPYLCPHREASPVHYFEGLALLNLAGGKSSLCSLERGDNQQQEKVIRGEFSMNYGCIVPAPKEPGLLVQASLTQPRPLGPNIAWSCVRTTQCGRLKAKKKKKQRKKNTGNSLCPSYGRAFLENQQQGKGCCPPRRGTSGRKSQAIF